MQHPIDHQSAGMPPHLVDVDQGRVLFVPDWRQWAIKSQRFSGSSQAQTQWSWGGFRGLHTEAPEALNAFQHGE
jgi:hypothetical protein